MYVYNENINLFDKIGDKTIADLKLQALGHNLNLNTWLASFTNTDYVYAVADSKPFPMSRLANIKGGKAALLGSDWDGTIDLTNEKERNQFLEYLFL